MGGDPSKITIYTAKWITLIKKWSECGQPGGGWLLSLQSVQLYAVFVVRLFSLYRPNTVSHRTFRTTATSASRRGRRQFFGVSRYKSIESSERPALNSPKEISLSSLWYDDLLHSVMRRIGYQTRQAGKECVINASTFRRKKTSGNVMSVHNRDQGVMHLHHFWSPGCCERMKISKESTWAN